MFDNTRLKFGGGWLLNGKTGRAFHFGEGFRFFSSRSALDEVLKKVGASLGSAQTSVTSYFVKK